MKKPIPSEVTEYAKSIGFNLDGERFCDYYGSKGWMVGSSPMKNWKMAVHTWKRNQFERRKNGTERNAGYATVVEGKYFDPSENKN